MTPNPSLFFAVKRLIALTCLTMTFLGVAACMNNALQSDINGAPETGRYLIKSVSSGLCLTIRDGNFQNDNQIVQGNCDGRIPQIFELKRQDGDWFQILTHDSTKSFDIPDASQKPGTNIIIFDKLQTDNQIFKLEKEGADQFYIRSKSSNQVLDVPGGSGNEGTAVMQFPLNKGSNQRWVFEKWNGAAQSKTVELTRGNHVYFKGDDNQREKKFTVKLPDSTDGYSRVNLHFKLSCPDGKCDAWDRLGTFGVYSNQHDKRYLELLRFMTPYGMGGEWNIDVTDFLPLFEGTQEFRLFIDTWVGPGNSAGNGWLVDLSLNYTAGYAREKTVLIVPILSMDDIAYGNPKSSTQRKANIVPLLGYKSAIVRSLITGHGQGNAQNCAEFCAKEHSIKIGNTDFKKTIWRDDCSTTTDQRQGGNAKSGRAGWCPGDIVKPWIQDVTHAVDSQPSTATYDVEAYENTCRPDAVECKGCVFNTPCAYDGGLHTDPKYYVTSYVIYKN